MTGPVVTGERTATANPALFVDQVSWHVGAVPIIDDVTLEVRPGEFVALIGPNGAGKTSLFNVVCAGRVRAG